MTINLGVPTGPRLRDLSLAQEKMLDLWLTSTLGQRRPNRREEMPVDFTRALATLARRRGIRFTFTSSDMRVKREVMLGRNVPGAVGGSKRKVSVQPRPATVGHKVEPWNMRDWRE